MARCRSNAYDVAHIFAGMDKQWHWLESCAPQPTYDSRGPFGLESWCDVFVQMSAALNVCHGLERTLSAPKRKAGKSLPAKVLNLNGVDETRTRDLLRDRQAF